jgi:hypothetical protein
MVVAVAQEQLEFEQQPAAVNEMTAVQNGPSQPNISLAGLASSCNRLRENRCGFILGNNACIM